MEGGREWKVIKDVCWAELTMKWPFYFLKDADLVYICTNVPVFCLKLWSSRTFWQDACCWGIGADFLITAGPGHVIRKLIKVYLKLLISPWKVYLKHCIRRLLLIKQWRERLSLTSFKLYCGFSVVISNVSQHAANMQRRWDRHCDIIPKHDGWKQRRPFQGVCKWDGRTVTNM